MNLYRSPASTFTHTQPSQLFRSSILVSALITSSLAVAAPTGPNVVRGNADITLGTTTVVQTGSAVAIEWQSFDLTSSELVDFSQPSSSAIAVNHVKSGSFSTINGAIEANGKVFIVNPAGVLIGINASIDVGGLLLTDLVPDLDQLNESEMTASDPDISTGAVVNRGHIRTGSGGTILVGQQVINSGVISSTGGDIYLAAADEVNIVFGATGSLGIELTEPIKNVLPNSEYLIENQSEGLIAAIDGADLHLRTQIVDGLLSGPSMLQNSSETVLAMVEQAGETYIVETINADSSVDNAIDEVVTSSTPPPDTNVAAVNPIPPPSAFEPEPQTITARDLPASQRDEPPKSQQVVEVTDDSESQVAEEEDSQEEALAEERPRQAAPTENEMARHHAHNLDVLLPTCRGGGCKKYNSTKRALGKFLINKNLRTRVD